MSIIEFEGRYFHQIAGASRYYISKCGRVFASHLNRLLKAPPQSEGYPQAGFKMDDGTHKRLLIHRLVALQFVPNPEPEKKKQVNHRDRNRRNCQVCNLEWVTAWENERHARTTAKALTTDGSHLLANLSGFCLPLKDYLALPRLYRFEPVPTSYPKPVTDATRA